MQLGILTEAAGAVADDHTERMLDHISNSFGRTSRIFACIFDLKYKENEIMETK